MDQVTEIRCSSCHGTVDEYADPTRAGLPNLIKQGTDSRPTFFLKSKLTGQQHYVYQVRDSVISQLPGARDPRTGERIYTKRADVAHGRWNGEENLEDGLGIKLLDPSQPAGQTTREDFSHADTLECAACHATWGNMCYGCHLTLSDYDPAGGQEPLSDYSNISGKLTPGKIIQKDVTFVSMLDIPLGINSNGKVQQFTPAGKLFFRHLTFPDGADDFMSRSGSNYGGSYRTYRDRLGFGNTQSAGLSPQDLDLGGISNANANSDRNAALAMNPLRSHTIQRKPRNCTQCHIPVGHGTDPTVDPYVRAPMVAWGSYPKGADAEISAYLASVPNTTQRDSGAVFSTTAGFLIPDIMGADESGTVVSTFTPGGEAFATATAGDTVAHRLDWVVLEDGFPLATSSRAQISPPGPLYRTAPGGGAGPLSAEILSKLKDEVRVYDLAEFTRTGNKLPPVFFVAEVSDTDGDGFCPEGVDNDGSGTCMEPGETGGEGFFDCDDADPEVNPDQLENCVDLIDNNCDGLADSLDAACEGGLDKDGDGWCPSGQDSNGDGDCIDPGETDGSGLADCDDEDPLLNPGKPEDCFDGADNNCNNAIDALDIECKNFSDKDRDGWCAIGQDLNGDNDCADVGEREDEEIRTFDCNVNSATTYPGAVEICTDNEDNNCDGRIDCGAPCMGCDDGSTCAEVTDCKSGVCLFGRCQTATCNDTVKNGQETDADCGGTCRTCADGKAALKILIVSVASARTSSVRCHPATTRSRTDRNPTWTAAAPVPTSVSTSRSAKLPRTVSAWSAPSSSAWLQPATTV